MKKQKRWSDPFAQREAEKYQNPVPSRECVIEFLNQAPAAQSKSQILKHFKINTAFEIEAMRRRLRAMIRDGQLLKSRDGTYQALQKGEAIRGRIEGHKEGFGFVKPEDGTEKIFISARQMRTVLDGDSVLVQVVGVDRENRREGFIVEVLERKRTQILGRFFMEGGVGFVEPDNQRINQDIIVSKDQAKGATSGQIVLVKILAPPTMHTQAIGRVIEILGDYMSPGMETEMAIRSYELPHEWPESVLDETQNFSDQIPPSAYEERKDLRTLPLVTIDGEDARDFDDAVYCEPCASGWRLVVAIADVSYYVKPGSALNEEAKERGNSVYFPSKVIPMLPPVLSNDLCSLRQNVDRLAFVCDMTISQEGLISQYQFYRAVISSHARLTYTEVAHLLEHDEIDLDKKYHKIMPHLHNLHQLYQVLYRQRRERGGLEFDSSEVSVKFGPDKKIKQFVPIVRNDAHRMIEECMLCANISAAKFLVKHKMPALFRVHDGPKREKLVDLNEFLRELGLKLGGGDLPQPIDYANLLEESKDRLDSNLIQTLLLRSLTQAFYSDVCDPHFGLAVDEYTHFTSPIRRYPDLLVHRAIANILEKKKPGKRAEDLSRLGEHCSMTDRRAEEATRDVLSWLRCEYMTSHIGEKYQGVITGVTAFGVFVSITKLSVEGLVHISTLPGKDYFRFDAVRHRLIGQNSKKKYCLGDVVRIQVARADVELRQIDFLII